MPTLSITKNYADNTTLTEAQLDSAFSSVTTFINTTKLDDDNLQASGISRSKLKTTSDNNYIGYVNNLGLTLASGVLTITQADASALSSTEGSQGTIAFPHTTAGRTILLDITAAKSFTDDSGSSDITGEEFGATTGIAWDEDRPFYLYAVNSDDTASGVEFAISPNPMAVRSPATANIGYHGNPASTPSDENFFFLTATDVTSTHNQKPCVRIGGIRMQMSASDDWTIQTLDESKGDGIRPDPYVGREFTMVEGQMGAKNTTTFLSTGVAVVPTWATPANITYNYSLGLDGICHIYFDTSQAGNATNGSGGVANLGLALPYKASAGGRQEGNMGRYKASAVAGDTAGGILGRIEDDTSDLEFRDTNYVTIQNNDFSDSNDDLSVRTWFRAFRQE